MPPDAPLVLAFDTSAAHCAAALLRGEAILAERSEPMARGQAERLMVLVDELLHAAGVQARDLDAIGVGIGPGNFTGIRLSVAAARGLALGLGIPAVGVSGFEALAEGRSGPVLAVLDAPRGQVFVQRMDGGTPMLCDSAALPVALAEGAPTCIGSPATAAQLGLAAATPLHPPAVAIARIAARRHATPGPRPAPLYLRAPDAAPARDSGPAMLP